MMMARSSSQVITKIIMGVLKNVTRMLVKSGLKYRNLMVEILNQQYRLTEMEHGNGNGISQESQEMLPHIHSIYGLQIQISALKAAVKNAPLPR